MRLIDTAFFEFTTVTTNILEQALINDAEGKLTLDVGSEGERGLTINIDWGAPTARFQQIDGLSGDAPPLVVEHLYFEKDDILDSTLNGRPAATEPLEVRFSVRHHESIQVFGTTVQQADGPIEVVEGEVVSSTDNPLTFESEDAPTLESGETRFIIPNLSIPVAFFPVRNVIPESDTPEIIVQSEKTFTVSQSSFETVEVSVSSSVTQEEYFQIRALSPDPDGEDLAAPERLPDDILSGDKLKQLFSQLPDGKYEIQYVLGSGNEQTIKTVDLRGGEEIVLSEDLEGGQLKLKLIEDEEQQDEVKENNNAQPLPAPVPGPIDRQSVQNLTPKTDLPDDNNPRVNTDGHTHNPLSAAARMLRRAQQTRTQ